VTIANVLDCDRRRALLQWTGSPFSVIGGPVSLNRGYPRKINKINDFHENIPDFGCQEDWGVAGVAFHNLILGAVRQYRPHAPATGRPETRDVQTDAIYD
jgi:hypothetical protein